MPVNYFNAHHTESNLQQFGLYDEPDPIKAPAYILEAQRTKWIGIVNNPNQITVHFHGIDNDLTVRVYKAPPHEKEWESNCDGMLHYNNNVSFIELKERQGSGWLAGATTQLINTVKLFAMQQNLNDLDNVDAFVCNSMRPRSNGNHMKELQRFVDETAHLNFKGLNVGLRMDVRQIITI
jgi:hypothetical protein